MQLLPYLARLVTVPARGKKMEERLRTGRGTHTCPHGMKEMIRTCRGTYTYPQARSGFQDKGSSIFSRNIRNYNI